jgi:rubrerythrin
MDLNGSETHHNLEAAFAREAMANRRYLFFAEVADIEGHPRVAAAFREVAESETGHARGHLEYLQEVGDPVTGEPIDETAAILAAAAAGERADGDDLYPTMADVARREGFGEIADWFDTLARAERAQADRFQRLLDELS